MGNGRHTLSSASSLSTGQETDGRELLRALPCWVEIDLDRVAANVRSLRRWIGPASLAAVVKADGYGLGAAEIALSALAAGTQRLAVARIHEAVDLRNAGINAPILVLSRTDPTEADVVACHDLTVTVDTPELTAALERSAARTGRSIPVHIKVDTGMHRFGVEPDGALPLARALSDARSLRVEAIWTHFASADAPDPTATIEQLRLFNQVVQQLGDAGYRFPMRHAANSAGTLAFPDSHMEMVRVGLSLYGISPLDTREITPTLRPAVALKARVARRMTLAPGDTVGYGNTWTAPSPTHAATLTAGYADGVPRMASNRGSAMIGGRKVPVLGRVSMDHTVVDVSGVPNVRVGDEALFYGEGTHGNLDIWDAARAADTIPWDLLTGTGPRVPRVYIKDGRVQKIARLNGSVDVRP